MDKLPPKGSSSAEVLEQVHQPRTTSNTLRTLTVPTPEEIRQTNLTLARQERDEVQRQVIAQGPKDPQKDSRFRELLENLRLKQEKVNALSVSSEESSAASLGLSESSQGSSAAGLDLLAASLGLSDSSQGSSASGQESSAASQEPLELGFSFGSREGLVSAENTDLILVKYQRFKRRNKPLLLAQEVETPYSSSTNPLPDRLDGKAGLEGEEGVDPLHSVPSKFPGLMDRRGVVHDRLFINLLRNLRFLLGDEARSEDDGFGAKLKFRDSGYIPSKNPKLLLKFKFPPGALEKKGYLGSFTIKGIEKCLRLDEVLATTDESREHGVNLGNITLTYFLDDTQDIKFEAIFNPFTKIIFIRIFKKKLEGGYTQMYESEYRLDLRSKQIFFRPYTEELAQIPFPIVKERFMGKPKKFVNPYVLIAQHFGTKKSFEDVEKGRENFLKKLLLNNVLDATQKAMLASMLATDESVKERNSELFRLYELYKTGTKERPIKDILSFDEEFTTTQWASPKLSPNSVKAFQRFGKLDPRIVLVRKKERQQLTVTESQKLDGDVPLNALTKALKGYSKEFVQREVEFYAPVNFGYKRPFTLTDILKSRYYSNYLFEELEITEANLLKWFSGIEEFRSDVFLTVSLFCHFINPDNSGFVDMDKLPDQIEFKPHTKLELFKSYPAQFKQYIPEPVREVPCLQFFERRKFIKGDAQKNMLGGVFGTDVSECPVSDISPFRKFQYCRVFEALSEEDCRLEIALGQGGLNERARAIFNELITGLKAPGEVVEAVEDDIEERLEALKNAQFPSLDGLSVAQGRDLQRPSGFTLPPLRTSFAAAAAAAPVKAAEEPPTNTVAVPGAPIVANPEQIRQIQLTERELEQGKSDLSQILETLKYAQMELNEELRRRSRPNEGGALRSDIDLVELDSQVDNLKQRIRQYQLFVNRKESKLLELRKETLQQSVPQRAFLPPLSEGISQSLLLSRGLTTALPLQKCIGEECDSWETVGFKEQRLRALKTAKAASVEAVSAEAASAKVQRPVAELPSRLPETTEEDYGEASYSAPQRKVVGSSRAKRFVSSDAAKELLTKQNLQMLISELEASTDQDFDKKLLRLIIDGRNYQQIIVMLNHQIFRSGNEVFTSVEKEKLRKLFVGTLKERKMAMLEILGKIDIEEYDLAKEKKFRADKGLGKRPIPEDHRKDFDKCCKLPKLSELKVANIPKDPETTEFELEEDSSPSFKIVKAFLDWFSNKLDESTRDARREGLAEEDLLLIKSVFRNATLIQEMVRKIINSASLDPEEKQLKDDLNNDNATKKRNAIFFIAKNNLGLLGQKFKQSELGRRKKERDLQVKEEQGKENELRDKLLGVETAIEENSEKIAETQDKYAKKEAEVAALETECKSLEREIRKLKIKKPTNEEEKSVILKKEEELREKKGLLEQEEVGKAVLNSERTKAINEGKPLQEEKKRLLEQLKPFDSVNVQKSKVFEARTSVKTKNDNIVSLLETFEAIKYKLEEDLKKLGRLRKKKGGDPKKEATSIKEEANGSFPLGIAEKLIEENEKTLDLETKARIAKLKALILKYNILKDKINIHYDEFYGERVEAAAIQSAKQKIEALEIQLVGLETAELDAQAAYESQLDVEQTRSGEEDEGEEREYISIHINEGGVGGGRNINIEGYFSELSRQDQETVRALRVEKKNPKFGIRNKYLSTREEYFRVKYEKYKLKYLSLKSEYFR